jgi:hypothetical protein
MRIAFAPRLSLLLVASLVVSFAAFSINGNLGIHWWHLLSSHRYLELTLRVFAPGAAWLLLMSLGLILHRMRALWLLVGAPLALYWPYKFIVLALECWTGTAPGYMC